MARTDHPDADTEERMGLGLVSDAANQHRDAMYRLSGLIGWRSELRGEATHSECSAPRSRRDRDSALPRRSGWVCAVAEDRLALGGPPVTRTFAAGDAFHFSAADIHRVRHTGSAPAVTIHAYSPPLWRMGAYEILPGGELRRHSLSYAEELRPLA